MDGQQLGGLMCDYIHVHPLSEGRKGMYTHRCCNYLSLALAGTERFHSTILGELPARFRFAQCRFFNLAAKTKRNFARFDFLRTAQLHFDRNGADHRHAVAVIHHLLHEIRKELPLVIKGRAALEAYPRNVTKLPDARLDALHME